MKTKTFTSLSLLLASLLFACGHDQVHGDQSLDGEAAHDSDQAHETASIDEQRRDYPIDTCVVSGEKLGDMGDPVDHVVGDRLIRLCCKSCVKEIVADPESFVARLDAAAKGEEQDGDGHDHDDHDG